MRKRIRRSFFVIMLLAMVNYSPGEIGGHKALLPVPTVAGSRVTNYLSAKEEYAHIDNTVTSFMKAWDIHGASVAVAREGKMVFARGYGFADADRQVEVEPFHMFRIASVSKLITATAVMKLAEEERLELHQKVFGSDGILSDHYFSDPRDKRVMDITVAHLLSHSGGWTTRWGDQMFMPHVVAASLDTETPVSTREIVRFALNKRLHFTPGTGRSYSNLGYAILGLVIEEVTGMSYENYCRRYLFEPSGIFDLECGKNLRDERAPFEVEYFEPSNAIPKKSIYNNDEMVPASYGGNDIEALGAAGGWIASAPDLLKFVLAVDGMDAPSDIIDFRSIDYMTSFGNGASPVGWKAATSNGYWWRTGSFPGTSAMIRREPDGLIWVVLFNTNTWKQSMFPTDISRMMSRAINGTKQWIDTDLFNYQIPIPLAATGDAESNYSR
ncbi:MAG: serine hydrolase domain-containing protein [Bacteroidales bacterium]